MTETVVALDEVGSQRQVPQSQREPGWASLGAVLDEPMNTAQMLDYAGLSGWNLRLEELPYPYAYHAPKLIVVRDTATDPVILGEVGKRYNVLSNEELFDFGDTLLDSGEWAAAGAFAHDTKIFGSLRLNRTTSIGDEEAEHYLMVATSHDGTLSVSASITPIIPSCENTLNFAIRTAKQSYKFRHTATMAGRIMAAREALGLADTYITEWDKAMHELISQEVTNFQFEEMIDAAFKPNDTKAGMTRFDKTKDAIWDNWVELPDATRGTKYGAVNALNEFHMWGSRGRGDNGEENIAASRAGFNPVWNNRNNELLELVKAW
jgi:phage/plasmid-like protein (TIGR03299 family)